MKTGTELEQIYKETVKTLRHRTFFAIMELLKLKTEKSGMLECDFDMLAQLLSDEMCDKGDSNLIYTESTLASYLKAGRDINRPGNRIFKSLEAGIKAEENAELTACWKKEKRKIKDLLLAYDEYKPLCCEKNNLENWAEKKQDIQKMFELSSISQVDMYNLSLNIDCIGLQNPFEATFFRRVLLLETQERKELKKQLSGVNISATTDTLFPMFSVDTLLSQWLDLRNRDYRPNCEKLNKCKKYKKLNNCEEYKSRKECTGCKEYIEKINNPVYKSAETIANYLEQLPGFFLSPAYIALRHIAEHGMMDTASIDIFLAYKYFMSDEQKDYWQNELDRRTAVEQAAAPIE